MCLVGVGAEMVEDVCLHISPVKAKWVMTEIRQAGRLRWRYKGDILA